MDSLPDACLLSIIELVKDSSADLKACASGEYAPSKIQRSGSFIKQSIFTFFLFAAATVSIHSLIRMIVCITLTSVLLGMFLNL
jgi:hypothetical protein